jgi:hypothetical protein
MADAAANTPPETSSNTEEDYGTFTRRLLHGTADEMLKAGCTEFMLVGYNPATERAVVATNRGGAEDQGLGQMLFLLGVAQQAVMSRIIEPDQTKTNVYDDAEAIGKVLQDVAEQDRRSKLN